MAGNVQSKEYLAGLWETVKARAQHTAAPLGTGYGNKKLTHDEKLAVFSGRKLSIEQEWDLWREGKLSPEAIGMQVFPNREQLAKSGGNIEPSQWIKAANDLANDAEKRRRGEEPMPPDTTFAPPEMPGTPEMEY